MKLRKGILYCYDPRKDLTTSISIRQKAPRIAGRSYIKRNALLFIHALREHFAEVSFTDSKGEIDYVPYSDISPVK